MLIAIEGIDGAGKTSIGKRLSENLNFIYIEKAMHVAFNIKIEEYVHLREHLKDYSDKDDNILAWFFGLNNMLCALIAADNNVVADRYLGTNYFWYGTKNNNTMYESILSVNGRPDLTILLDVSEEVASKRIEKRNNPYELERELKKTKEAGRFKTKVEKFLVDQNLHYITIDTNERSISQIVELSETYIANMIKQEK